MFNDEESFQIGEEEQQSDGPESTDEPNETANTTRGGHIGMIILVCLLSWIAFIVTDAIQDSQSNQNKESIASKFQELKAAFGSDSALRRMYR